jgi:hypothetical protein
MDPAAIISLVGGCVAIAHRVVSILVDLNDLKSAIRMAK